MMKYAPEDYLYSDFYAGDEDTTVIEVKLVKCRKPHQCMGGCQTIIQPGEVALLEKAIMDDSIKSCYTCIPCLDGWLDRVREAAKGIR